MARTRTLGIIFVHLVALAAVSGFVLMNRNTKNVGRPVTVPNDPESEELETSLLEMLERQVEDGSGSAAYAERRATMRQLLKDRKFQEARKALEEMQREQMLELGVRHPETIASTVELAVVQMRTNELGPAIASLERSLALIEEIPINNPSLKFDTEYNLGLAYQQTRREEKALPLLESALAWRVETSGEHHLQTLLLKSAVAQSYWVVGRAEESIRLMEDTVEHLRSAEGASDVQRVVAYESLAMMLEQTNRREQALPYLDAAIEICRRRLGDTHPRTLRAQDRRVTCLFAMGKKEDALSAMEEIVAQLKAKLSEDDEMMMQARMNMVTAYRRAQEPDQALIHQAVLSESMLAKYGAEHAMTLVTNNFTAEMLSDARQFEKAESLLQELKRNLDAEYYKLPPEQLEQMRVDNMQRFVRLYESWDKPEMAEEWKNQLEENAQKSKDSEPESGDGN